MANIDGDRWRVDDHQTLLAEHGFDFGNCCGREADLLSEDPSHLPKDRVADQESVLRQDGVQDVRAESPRGKCTDEDIGVEIDLHDTSRKMSSSVR